MAAWTKGASQSARPSIGSVRPGKEVALVALPVLVVIATFDKPTMMQYYLDILKDAAANHLMVNFHGSTIPRGWQRTHPNLVSGRVGTLEKRDAASLTDWLLSDFSRMRLGEEKNYGFRGFSAVLNIG